MNLSIQSSIIKQNIVVLLKLFLRFSRIPSVIKDRRCHSLVLLLLIPISILPAQRQLRLPVYINSATGEFRYDQLSKEDFTLCINDRPREINRMEIKIRRIEKTSDLSRHFFLSFHMDEFNREIVEGIGYFIDHILDRSDSLTVLTPLKSYQMKMDRGKAAVYDAMILMLKAGVWFSM
jgi:hypothetical protein